MSGLNRAAGIALLLLGLALPGYLRAAPVVYGYDAAGRLISADYGATRITYSYDPSGNVLSRTVAPKPAAAANYQGLWWRKPAASESGWGINFAHQGDTIFATWFTYDASGKPLWFIALLQRTGVNLFVGDVSTVQGIPFNSSPWDTSKIVETVIGTMSVTFIDATNATMSYKVNGVVQTKEITPQVFGPLPTCVWGAQPDLTLATNYQDVWWAAPPGSESGWGINFTHQGDTIFATWFTYNAAGEPLWLIALLQKSAAGVYTGAVSTVTGPPFYALPFDPASVVETQVGTATVTFANGNSASFDYTVNGITQTKTITRQVFASPGTVCQ